jgi:putative oxidoreductase
MQTFPDETSAPTHVVATNDPPRLLAARSTIAEAALSALRIVSALLFMQHGVQKLFGWLLPAERAFNGAPEIFTRMWLAGMLETFGGLLLLVGLFTRPVAFLLAGQMAFAYFIAHAGQGFWPILNGGELAALYSFVFLALSALGGGRFSIDRVLVERRERAIAAANVSASKTGHAYPDDRRKSRRRSRSAAGRAPDRP